MRQALRFRGVPRSLRQLQQSALSRSIGRASRSLDLDLTTDVKVLHHVSRVLDSLLQQISELKKAENEAKQDVVNLQRRLDRVNAVRASETHIRRLDVQAALEAGDRAGRRSANVGFAETRQELLQRVDDSERKAESVMNQSLHEIKKASRLQAVAEAAQGDAEKRLEEVKRSASSADFLLGKKAGDCRNFNPDRKAPRRERIPAQQA